MSFILYKNNPKMLNQFQYCEHEQVPYLVIVGEDEKAKGGVKVRNAISREEVSLVHTIICLFISSIYTGKTASAEEAAFQLCPVKLHAIKQHKIVQHTKQK